MDYARSLMRFWYVNEHGDSTGPVEWRELDQLSRSGLIHAESPVMPVTAESDQTWRTWADFASAELSAVTSAAEVASVVNDTSPVAVANTARDSLSPMAATKAAVVTARDVMQTIADVTLSSDAARAAIDRGRGLAERTVILARGDATSSAGTPSAELQGRSPTETALLDIVSVRTSIGRTPWPGALRSALRRIGVGTTAAIALSIAGSYVAEGLDNVAEMRARVTAERRGVEQQEQMIEQQYEQLSAQVPAGDLRRLLREAGSKGAVLSRISQDGNGRWVLRKE